jgi:NAD(P)H-quinone oxidoreductase subunit 5
MFGWMLLVIPLLPLVVGVGLGLMGLGKGQEAGRAGLWMTGAAWGTVILAVVAVLGGVGLGGYRMRLGGEPWGMTFRMDAVSGVMVLLVSTLGLRVLAFSRRHLEGDVGETRYFGWMGVTQGAVLGLMLSGDLMVLWVSWVATSLGLHRLLLHYPERAGAVFSARKKFVYSRLGDVCLGGAFGWVAWKAGTWEFDGLFEAVKGGRVAGLGWVGMLLVLGAMLKSAQFPFHGWLPDTLETPTPVSAFMHAGIINAGGYLMIRLSPVLVEVPMVLDLLVGVGALTAAFGSVVMLVQPGVKRALAYSTVAQMGFMLMQCGLGAFGLALLHMVAHSIYKAHAFLNAGSTVGAASRRAIPLKTPMVMWGVVVGFLLVAMGAWVQRRLVPEVGEEPWVCEGVLALAIAYGIGRAGSAGDGSRRWPKVVGMAAVWVTAGLLLRAGTGLLTRGLPEHEPSTWVGWLVMGVFVGLFGFQVWLWRAGASVWGRRWYVHAMNGFYVGTMGNRLLDWLWPRSTRVR